MTEETLFCLPRFTREDLPPWFRRPVSTSVLQGSLFRDKLIRVASVLRVSVDDLEKWRGKGWLGFDITPVVGRLLEPYEVDEIVFLRDLTRSGLTEAEIEALLSELPRPFVHDPQRLAYSFSFGWIEAAPPPDPLDIVDEQVDGWLYGLAEDGQIDRILAVLDSCRRALSQAFSDLNGASNDDEQGGKA